jgi:hypothetical protein
MCDRSTLIPAGSATRAIRPLPTLDWELMSVSDASFTGPSETSSTEHLHFLQAIGCCRAYSRRSQTDHPCRLHIDQRLHSIGAGQVQIGKTLKKLVNYQSAATQGFNRYTNRQQNRLLLIVILTIVV